VRVFYGKGKVPNSKGIERGRRFSLQKISLSRRLSDKAPRRLSGALFFSPIFFWSAPKENGKCTVSQTENFIPF
jgi:hypothetical protein